MARPLYSAITSRRNAASPGFSTACKTRVRAKATLPVVVKYAESARSAIRPFPFIANNPMPPSTLMTTQTTNSPQQVTEDQYAQLETLVSPTGVPPFAPLLCSRVLFNRDIKASHWAEVHPRHLPSPDGKPWFEDLVKEAAAIREPKPPRSRLGKASRLPITSNMLWSESAPFQDDECNPTLTELERTGPWIVDTLGWYLPAHENKPDRLGKSAWGVYCPGNGVACMAKELNWPGRTDDEACRVAALKLYYHECAHGLIEDLVFLTEQVKKDPLAVSPTLYREQSSLGHLREEAFCNTVALACLRRDFSEKVPTQDPMCEAVQKFMENQGPGYKHFRKTIPALNTRAAIERLAWMAWEVLAEYGKKPTSTEKEIIAARKQAINSAIALTFGVVFPLKDDSGSLVKDTPVSMVIPRPWAVSKIPIFHRALDSTESASLHSSDRKITILIHRIFRAQVIDDGCLPAGIREYFVIDRDAKTITEFYDGMKNVVASGDFVYDPDSVLVRSGVHETFDDIADAVEASAPDLNLVPFTEDGGRLTLKLEAPAATSARYTNLSGVGPRADYEFLPPHGYLSFVKRWANPGLKGWDPAEGVFRSYPEDGEHYMGFKDACDEGCNQSLRTAHYERIRGLKRMAVNRAIPAAGAKRWDDHNYLALLTDLIITGAISPDLTERLNKAYVKGDLSGVARVLLDSVNDSLKPRYAEFADNWLQSLSKNTPSVASRPSRDSTNWQELPNGILATKEELMGEQFDASGLWKKLPGEVWMNRAETGRENSSTCLADLFGEALTQQHADSVQALWSKIGALPGALHLAASLDRWGEIEGIRDNGSFERMDFSGRTPFHYAAIEGRNETIQKISMKIEEDLKTIPDSTGRTAGHWLIQMGHVDCIEAHRYMLPEKDSAKIAEDSKNESFKCLVSPEPKHVVHDDETGLLGE